MAENGPTAARKYSDSGCRRQAGGSASAVRVRVPRMMSGPSPSSTSSANLIWSRLLAVGRFAKAMNRSAVSRSAAHQRRCQCDDDPTDAPVSTCNAHRRPPPFVHSLLCLRRLCSLGARSRSQRERIRLGRPAEQGPTGSDRRPPQQTVRERHQRGGKRLTSGGAHEEECRSQPQPDQHHDGPQRCDQPA